MIVTFMYGFICFFSNYVWDWKISFFCLLFDYILKGGDN